MSVFLNTFEHIKQYHQSESSKQWTQGNALQRLGRKSLREISETSSAHACSKAPARSPPSSCTWAADLGYCPAYRACIKICMLKRAGGRGRVAGRVNIQKTPQLLANLLLLGESCASMSQLPFFALIVMQLMSNSKACQKIKLDRCVAKFEQLLVTIKELKSALESLRTEFCSSAD